MKRIANKAGFSLVELMVVVGLMGGISLAIVGFMNNMFKSVSSVQKSMTRTDTMKGISAALSNKETCAAALGAGTLSIPASWASGTSNARPLTQIKVGGDVLAEVDKTIENITISAMRLEMSAGPYPVQYNIAPSGSAPDLRPYRRYFAKLIVSPKKIGGAANNLGGDSFRDSEFRIAILVNDSNVLSECFGGIEESDLTAFCEKAFDGKYDASLFPWCTVEQMSIGNHRDSIVGGYPRFSVLEKQNPVAGSSDLTMALYGNGTASSNGPGLWLAQNISTPLNPVSNTGVIGFANRADAFTAGSKVGDLVIANRSATGDLSLGTADAHIKIRQATQDITIDRPIIITALGSGTVGKHPLSIHSPDGQGRILLTGASDVGETHSAVYLAGNTPGVSTTESWVMAHKAAGSGYNHAFQINRWVNPTTMFPGIAINTNMNVGIGTMEPSEKLHVAGNLRVGGNVTVTDSVVVSGTVTAASDERLKKEIKPVKDPLERILKLKPVTFQWKKSKDTSTQLGFIAQDVEKVVPEVVKTSASDGLKSLAYSNLVSLVVGAVQELFAQLQNILSHLKSQESQMNLVEKRLEQMNLRLQQLESENQKLSQKVLKCSEAQP